MKNTRLILTALLGALLLVPIAGWAEDIDIYSGLGGASNVPNIMVIMDNAANSDASMSSCNYWDVPASGVKSIDNYKCALDNIVHGMSLRTDGTALVKLGITLQSGVYLKLTPVDDQPYAGTACPSCATIPATTATPAPSHPTTNREAIISAVRGITKFSGQATQGDSFQETWAYYTGGNGGTTGKGVESLTTYTSTSTNADTGCQKNYVIFISGVTSSAHAHTGSELAPLQAAVANSVAAGNLTATQGTALTTQITGNGENPWAWEWARFMYTNDNVTSASGVQGIVTYSVAAGSPVYPAAMGSMENYIWGTANYGGGKYFAATSFSDIKNDILKILNEVQAVNSVFASSSLPVSVNAQGTFLNQIFMGMFRPDGNGLPRWVGNLKQYKFCYDVSTKTLSLCDSLGISAISAAKTGFISANAVSYWTSKNALVEPDLGGGYWRKFPQGASGGYDLEDGELVEKGGAAQVIRLANLKDDYTATAGASTNPRNVYSYCPGGTCTSTLLSDSSNVFSLANSNISSGMFGASNLTVKSIVRCVVVSADCAAVNGTIAVVTTNTNHGYTTGTSVTITGATQTEYKVTQNVTVNSSTKFTITGLPDYPTNPATSSYVISPAAVAVPVTSITRPGSTTSSTNSETATVTTAAAHSFIASATVNIGSTTTSAYTGNVTVASSPAPTTFNFYYPVPVYPPVTALNAYTVVEHPYSINLSSIAKVTGTWTATTTTVHGFHTGEAITIAGTNASFNGNWVIASVPSTTSFTLTTSGSMTAATGGTVTPTATAVAITTLTRTGNGISATATATGLTANYFANGDKVDINTAGINPNEAAYTQSAATITCTTSPASTIGGPCTGTTFTYPVTTSPSLSAPGTLSASPITISVTVPAGSITRAGTKVTVKNVTAGSFADGSKVNISFPSGTSVASEIAYTGLWTIDCTGYTPSCTQFSLVEQVVLSPATPATGTISVYSGSAPPDKTNMVNWVRGMDNNLDEASPDPTYATINVRPSIHGDVLHSRPTVINYGGTIGVVVFYGANDGVYRAVNGNQGTTTPDGKTSTLPVAGSELWSFIPTEFFGELTRLHDNSPVLALSSTPVGIVPTPRQKDYFIDGSSSIYQKINLDGTTNTAYLYLAMRRGGTMIYALDVTTPTIPKFKWKINNIAADFTELGQTWSQPKVAFIKGYCGGTACSSTNTPTPVMIFGGGYDTAEDNEPPTTDTMGRGIFIVDALSGNLVWKSTYGTASACSGTIAKASCTVLGMNYSIPADITLMDRTGNDGYIDRLYAVDVGGNIWRVDLEPTAGNTPDKWQVTQLAALGCNTGACSGTTPRKFFYPADVVPTAGYDAVLIGSGDREHPLYSHAAYNVINRFYMVKDLHPGNDATAPLQAVVTEKTGTTPNLADITALLSYDGTLSGYYVTLGTGEKVVNAPLTVAGYTYFGTNSPALPTSNSCTTNLGIAKGYRISPLGGGFNFVVYDGGGLPPSPVAGVVDVTGSDGKEYVLPFCIGCGGSPGIGGSGACTGAGCKSSCTGPDCKSSSGGTRPVNNVPTSRSRTYWYKESD